MTLPIPVELVERAVDELWDDSQSLRACALTCHGLLPRSRVHLFRTVHIPNLSRLNSLYRLLKSTPVLASFIRAVNVQTASLAEVAFDSAPLVLLPILPRLQCWEFQGFPWSLPFQMRTTALASLRQYPAVRELRLADLLFTRGMDLAKLLLALPHLRSLWVFYVKVETEGTQWNSLLTRLSQHLRLSALRVEHRSAPGLRTIYTLVQTAAPFIEELAISINLINDETREDSDAIFPSLLMHFTSLHTLTLLAIQGPYLDLLRSLAYLFLILQMGIPFKLKQLYIDFTGCTPFYVSMHLWSASNAAAWQNLDRVLCQSHRSYLDFQITFVWPHARCRSFDLWNSALAHRLPDSAKRSIYTAACHVDLHDWSYRHKRMRLSFLAAFPTGAWVVSCDDSDVYLWDTDFECLAGDVHAVARMAPVSSPLNCRYLVIASNDTTSQGWMVLDPQNSRDPIASGDVRGCIQSIPSAGYRIITHAVYGSPPKIAFMSANGAMGIVNIKTRSLNSVPRKPLTRHSQLRGGAFAVSADQHWLADWHTHGTMLVWDLTTAIPSLQFLFTLPHSSQDYEQILTATFNSQSTTLVGVSSRGIVWSWYVVTGIPLCLPSRVPEYIHLSPLSNIALSRNGMRLAWTSENGSGCTRSAAANVDPPWNSVTVIDLSDPTRRRLRSLTLRGHRACIRAFAFSPDGEFIVTASADHTVRLWRTQDGACLKTFTEHPASVTHVVFSDDGRFLVSGAEDGTVCIRKMEDIL